MATVFLARDVRHDRSVALKVLRPEIAMILGAERFLSEIRVTASLQHPNLLPLFDSGETNGLLFYVMPYVEGETLRARLERERQLSIDEAVRIAVAICGAVDYAHRRGIIHRDLKPENVLLDEGQPVVADFGIALAIKNAAGARLTGTGLSLGTPQYMSPEQANADRTIDARADVYAIGALTYEMLTGEPPHTGATAQIVMARLMTEDPSPISARRRTVPAQIEAAVHRALQKVPADRFETARDLADALNGKRAVDAPLESAHRKSSRRVYATAAGAALAAAALTWVVIRSPVADDPAVVRMTVALPDSAALNAGSFYRAFDLSSDAANLVYIGDNGLFVRPLNSFQSRRLTAEPAQDPRFSPDGAWVAYRSDEALKRIQTSGGAPTTIVTSVGRYGWRPGGGIVFTKGGIPVPELWEIPESGGAPSRLKVLARSGDKAFGTPTFIDENTALIPIVTAGDSSEIAAYRLSDGTVKYLGIFGAEPRYLPGGILIFVDDALDIRAVRFDARSLMVQGKPQRIASGVMRKNSSADLAVSNTGTLVFMPAIRSTTLVEIDRLGNERPFPPLPGLYGTPRYSPDGGRIALSLNRTSMFSSDIYVYDIASNTTFRTTNNGQSAVPEWSPDGRRIAWTQATGSLGGRAAELGSKGVYWHALDNSDGETLLVPNGLGLSFSPVGNFAVTNSLNSDGSGTLSRVDLAAPFRITPILKLERSSPPAARVSPDGRWIVYMSPKSGQSEVYVHPVSGSSEEYVVSDAGGVEPLWNPNGKELFYRSGSRLMAATLAMTPDRVVVTRRQLLFNVARSLFPVWANYDVSRDGNRFLFAKSPESN
jgi:serine/threonine-protein kinase